MKLADKNPETRKTVTRLPLTMVFGKTLMFITFIIFNNFHSNTFKSHIILFAEAFNEIITKMEELDLLEKLSKFEGNIKFKLTVRIFLKNPEKYYKTWKNLKNSID